MTFIYETGKYIHWPLSISIGISVRFYNFQDVPTIRN